MPPTSDGFKRPELGPKANNPRSRILDRSASAPASVFSRRSGQAPEDSLPECPETLASEELFPPRPPPLFPEAVASADGAEPEPIPSQTTSGPPAPSFSLQEETLSPPVRGGRRSLSNPQAKEMDDPERELHSEPNPGKELFEHPEEAASPLLFKEERKKILFSAGTGDTEGEVGLSFPEGRRSEDSMEVDHPKEASSSDENLTMEVEQSGPGSPPPQNDLSPGLDPGAALENPCVSLSHALKELHQLLVVSSKCEAIPEEHRGIPFPGHVKSFADDTESVEAREVQQMDESREKETVVESFAYEIESVEAREVQQLDEGREKEALLESFAYEIESVEVKEVQRLGENRETDTLLKSFADDMESVEAREVQQMDESREKEAVVESFAYELESVEAREVQQMDESHEKEAEVESFAFEIESVEVKEAQQLGEKRETDALLKSFANVMESREKEAGVGSFAYELESVEARKVQHLDEGHEKEALLESFTFEMESVEVKEEPGSDEKEALIARESSIASEQLCGAERCASPPRLLVHDHILCAEDPEESQLLPSEAQNAPRSIPRLHFPSGEDTQSSSNAALLPPPPPVSPVSGVDQIVRAGFTAQEAGEALVQADGNADLALLLLLAKNIVVPT